MKFENFLTTTAIYTSLIYSKATSYLYWLNVYIFSPYAFYLSYLLRFLIKNGFGSEALMRGRCLF